MLRANISREIWFDFEFRAILDESASCLFDAKINNDFNIQMTSFWNSLTMKIINVGTKRRMNFNI